jgi:hypothetical protein
MKNPSEPLSEVPTISTEEAVPAKTTSIIAIVITVIVIVWWLETHASTISWLSQLFWWMNFWKYSDSIE